MTHVRFRAAARTAVTLLVASLAASSVGAVAHAAASAPLKIEDFRARVDIVDPQFDSCGKNVAFVTRATDFAADKIVTAVHVIDVGTGVDTIVTRRSDGAMMPRWSPDGSKLAFLILPKKVDAPPASEAAPAPNPSASPEADKAYDARQIAVVSLRSTVPVVVTHEARGIDSFAWRPDGAGFAFITRDEAPNKKAIDAHDDAFEVGDNQWNLKEAPVPSHLWSIAAAGGSPHRITSGAFSLDGEPKFTHDGLAVLVQRYPTAYKQHYAQSRLVRVDVRTGAITTIVASARAEGRLSRDGKRLVYLSSNPRSFSINDVYLAAPDGGTPVDLTRRLDRGAADVAFDADDRSLLVAINDGTRTRLMHVGRGEPAAVDIGDRNVGAFDVDCRGRIAFAGNSAKSVAELFLVAPGGSVHALTHYNDAISRHPLARVSSLTWTTRDGVTADGVVTAPIGVAPGARAPLVLVIHGGPTSSSIQELSELPQLLAAHGFYVFEPNYRGSDNLGAAFAQATVPHITSVPGDDIEDGLAVMLKRFPIDPARIGISGWSEGGLLTSWLITHDTRWKLAMSGAAVNDWLMYRDLTDAQDFTPFFIGSTSPWTDQKMQAFYRSESPLTYAANVKTPTLIMTDAGDQRVPTPLAYAFYHAIRATGTPVTMVVIPADGHFPADPVRSEDVIRRWVEWFAQKL